MLKHFILTEIQSTRTKKQMFTWTWTVICRKVVSTFSVEFNLKYKNAVESQRLANNLCFFFIIPTLYTVFTTQNRLFFTYSLYADKLICILLLLLLSINCHIVRLELQLHRIFFFLHVFPLNIHFMQICIFAVSHLVFFLCVLMTLLKIHFESFVLIKCVFNFNCVWLHAQIQLHKYFVCVCSTER